MNKQNSSKLWKIIQEAGDYLQGSHFYRVYIEMNEEIRIIGESSTRPQLVRYVSEVVTNEK